MSNLFSRTYQRIRNESAEHLQEMNESYCSHLTKHARISFNMMYASVMLLIHGVVPAWCKRVGHEIVLREADNMEENPNYPIKKYDE